MQEIYETSVYTYVQDAFIQEKFKVEYKKSSTTFIEHR